MRLFVVGDNEITNAQVRAIAVRNGIECLPVDIAPFDRAAQTVGSARRDLTVLVIPPVPERGLAALQELHIVTQGPIVVVGPADNPKFILQVLREGADEYLDSSDLEADLEAVLIRLKRRQRPHSSDGGVIGVLAPSGGSGSSTVAVNLAVALAQNAERTALFDLRLNLGDQTLLLDVKPTHTLADLCRNCDRLDRSMFQQSLVRHPSGVHLLAAPDTAQDALSVTPAGVRHTLGLARTLMPFVVIDLDRSFGPEQVAAIVQADLILLVLRLDIISLHNTRRVLDHFLELGLLEDRVQLVVNRFRQPKEISVYQAEKVLGEKFFHFVPDAPGRINLSTNKGVPVVLEQPRAKVSRSFQKLASRIDNFKKRHRNNGHGGAVYSIPEGNQVASR